MTDPYPKAVTMLQLVYELIESGWCQNYDMLDRQGRACGSDEPFDTLCLSAAIDVARRMMGYDIADISLARGVILNAIETYAIERWNDDPIRTQADVLAAIAFARDKTQLWLASPWRMSQEHHG